MAGVGAKAFGERGEADGFERADPAEGADGREGEVEGGAHGGECHEGGRAVAADEDGQRRRRRELDQGGGGEEGAGGEGAREEGTGEGSAGEESPGEWGPGWWSAAPFAAARHENQRRQKEEADRVEVGAPRRLDDQEWGPEIPDEHRGGVAARAACDPVQEETAAEIEAEPEELGGDDGAAGEGDGAAGRAERAAGQGARSNAPCRRSAQKRHRTEQQLAERRVDGRDTGVVDLPVPGGAQGCEGIVAGWMGVGIDALREEVAVPEVAVDVVGELGRKREKREPGEDGNGPDEGDSACRARGGEARGPVGEEGRRREEEAGEGEGDAVQPAEGGEGRDEEEAEKEDEARGQGSGPRRRVLPRIAHPIYFTIKSPHENILFNKLTFRKYLILYRFFGRIAVG